MRLVEYTSERFEALRRAASQMGSNLNLTHRPFVDYYYAASEWCKLYLLLADEETVIATLGVERMRFQCGSRELMIGFGTNFYSLRPGAGMYLFLHWMKTCPVGLVFGGSDDTHRIIAKQNWTYFGGIRSYVLNNTYQASPGEAWWRAAAKFVLRHTQRTGIRKNAARIPADVRAEISVQEEKTYTQDLLPRRSPFAFRFTPTPEYLSWRYHLRVSFVRYRLFRILQKGANTGYVILNDSPEQIVVAQCDGEDPRALAYGVLLSLFEVAKERTRAWPLSLVSSHSEMQKIFEQTGFRPERTVRRFALGRLGQSVDLPPDTSNWLINLDWGDNGLRPPFQDQGALPNGNGTANSSAVKDAN